MLKKKKVKEMKEGIEAKLKSMFQKQLTTNLNLNNLNANPNDPPKRISLAGLFAAQSA